LCTLLLLIFTDLQNVGVILPHPVLGAVEWNLVARAIWRPGFLHPVLFLLRRTDVRFSSFAKKTTASFLKNSSYKSNRPSSELGNVNVSVSYRTVLSTKFLTASVLFTMTTNNYCISYWLPNLLDTEDGDSVSPTSDVRDSPRSYNRLKESKYIRACGLYPSPYISSQFVHMFPRWTSGQTDGQTDELYCCSYLCGLHKRKA